MAYIHQVPRAFQRVVTLEATPAGLQCTDCRQPIPTYKPHVRYRDEQLCLTDARDRGLVVAVRRPRDPPPPPLSAEQQVAAELANAEAF